MSANIPSRPRQVGQRRNFAIVAGQYNPDYVRGLMPLPDLPQGEYVVKLSAYAKNGQVLRDVEAPFTKADPT